MNKYKYIVALFSFSIPAIAFAQYSGSAGNDIWSLWEYLFYLISRLTQIFWVLAVVTFLWGLVEFLRQSDNAKEQEKAKKLMIGSIVAFGIAISFWALVTFVISSADLTVDDASIRTVTSDQ